MNRPPIFRIARRFLILAILGTALVTLMGNRTQTVKASDCYEDYSLFSNCYYNCAVEKSVCILNNPSNHAPCESQMQTCLGSCDMAHATFGSSCSLEYGLEHYTQPVDPNGACEDNAARLYENCRSGPVPFAFRASYFSCMDQLDGDVTYLDYCCGIARDDYVNFGCL